MQVFLCTVGDFSIAIPMDSISSLYLHAKNEHDNGLHDRMVMQREEQTFFSLLHFFNLSHENIRHCVILKNPDGADNKIILMITEVECEKNIPDNEIYPVPGSLKNMQFSLIFNGMQFDSDGKLVLLLNPGQIEQYTQRKLEI